jgi:acetoin utilization deacetylase AcuC-like enzyme
MRICSRVSTRWDITQDFGYEYEKEQKMNRVTILRDPAFKKHLSSAGNPETPERLRGLDTMLEGHELRHQFDFVPVRAASEAELAWVHSQSHITSVADSQNRDRTHFDYDTSGCRDTYEAAAKAAGAAIAAVDAVNAHPNNPAYAMVRPPGHHAEHERAMGFCFFNNAAVAAEYALRVIGMSKVFIFDWDVHHGNGTMHSFYDQNRVLYSSIHQFPHYPGTGTAAELGDGDGAGYTVNLPLPPGADNVDYRYLFDHILLPMIREYSPDLIIISAGFDAHEADPLSAMQLTSAMYGDMAVLLREAALQECEGRLILVLEGGYDISALSNANSDTLKALCGDWQPGESERPGSHSPAVRLVERLYSKLSEYWQFCESG